MSWWCGLVNKRIYRSQNGLSSCTYKICVRRVKGRLHDLYTKTGHQAITHVPPDVGRVAAPTKERDIMVDSSEEIRLA